jgi:hypothetical protein
VEFGEISADDRHGSARWEAWYTFSTGRKVHNRIDAAFEFADGLIVLHRDTFDLSAWAAQALGPMGRFFGGTPFLQKKIRSSAAKTLASFEKRNA